MALKLFFGLICIISIFCFLIIYFKIIHRALFAFRWLCAFQGQGADTVMHDAIEAK